MTDYAVPLVKVLLTSFISTFIIFNFIDRLFVRRYSEKWKYAGPFFLSWCLFIASAFFANGLISILITLSVTFLTALCLYHAGKSSDVLKLCLFLIYIILTEIVGQIVLSLIGGQAVSISHGDLLQSSITFVCYQFVMYFVSKKKSKFDHAGNLITLVVIPAISLFQLFVLVYLLKDQTDSTNKVLVLGACLLVLAINLIIYVLFQRIAVLNYQKMQYQLLQQQSQAQYKYFHELEQNYEEARKFFHDIKNHLNVMEELYKGAEPSANEYAEGIRNEMAQLDTVAPSTNRIINILIYKWRSEAKKHGITFTCQCEDIDLSFIEDKDLATILSNLLDNAFEECSANSFEHNFVDFTLCKINNFIVINLSNSSESVLSYAGERLRSGKENHLGLGLTNVQTTVENYQGVMAVSQKNQVFTVQLTFFGQE